MSPGILGKKIGMTQVFRPDGQAVPVTLLKTGPCTVVQRKTVNSDGYEAVQLGLVEFIKPSRINKPETGHLKKGSAEGVRFLREFRLDKGHNTAGAGELTMCSSGKSVRKMPPHAYRSSFPGSRKVTIASTPRRAVISRYTS